MNHETFIGTGHNPDGPDLPLGLGMQLAQEPEAIETFGRMSRDQKAAVIDFIQGATTGEDAKNRIADAVNRLNGGQTQF